LEYAKVPCLSFYSLFSPFFAASSGVLNARRDELAIGTTLALTGAFRTHALHGIQLAVQEVNDAGGVRGKQVKLYVEDFAALDLKLALSGARKLVDVNKVQLLLPLIIEDSEVVVP